MSPLAAVAGLVGGAVAGGTAGFVAAMLWADMDMGSLDAVGYVMAGIAVGAVGGVYVAVEIAT